MTQSQVGRLARSQKYSTLSLKRGQLARQSGSVAAETSAVAEVTHPSSSCARTASSEGVRTIEDKLFSGYIVKDRSTISIALSRPPSHVPQSVPCISPKCELPRSMQETGQIPCNR